MFTALIPHVSLSASRQSITYRLFIVECENQQRKWHIWPERICEAISLELKIDELVHGAEKDEQREQHDTQHASFPMLYEPGLIGQGMPCLVDEPRQEQANGEHTHEKIEVFSKYQAAITRNIEDPG